MTATQKRPRDFRTRKHCGDLDDQLHYEAEQNAAYRDFVLLGKLRTHPHAEIVAATIQVDRDEWASGGIPGDYPGEAEQRVEALDMLLRLLRGKE